MGVTNEFERDFNDTSFLKRPGRIDLVVFQNVPDAGDGHPGMQRAFRNYLHEGGMEDDLDINSHNIDNVIDINLSGEIVFTAATINSSGGEIHIHPNTGNTDGNLIIHPIGSNTASHIHLRSSVTSNHGILSIQIDSTTASLISAAGGAGTPPDTFNLNNANWDNINIGDASATITINAVGISATQFGWIGEMDQDVSKDQSPIFVGLTLSGALVTTSTVDGVDVSTFKTDYDSKIDQALKQASSPTFVGLTLSGALITTSTVDGVDISALKLNSMPTAADGDIDANNQQIINVVDPVDDQDAVTKKFFDDEVKGGLTTDVTEFANDTERNKTTVGVGQFIKTKQIDFYHAGHLDCRIYWEAKGGGGATTCHSRLYKNGSPVGTDHSNSAPTSYEAFTEDVTDIVYGDSIEIWGWAANIGTPVPCYIKNQRIRWAEYLANDP